MADTSVIGRASFVRGRVTGDGDLEIAGRVEGEIAVSGEVVVEATGLVAANIQGRRIVVRGAVKGDLVASELVVLEATARVVGDLRAPRIAVVQGGLVRGQVTTSSAATPARGRTASATAASENRAGTRAPATVSAAQTKPRAVVAAPAAPSTKPSGAKPEVKTVSASNGTAPRGATLAGARPGPPPPVVPVLKKGTKAVQKKR